MALIPIEKTEGDMVSVFVALYSGEHRIEQLSTTEAPLTSVVDWNENLTFSISICDLPRNSKLCFSVMRRKRGGGESRASSLLFWYNTTVFDHRGNLRSVNIRFTGPSSLSTSSQRVYLTSIIPLQVYIPADCGQKPVPENRRSTHL
eukprot:sb/3473817/